MTIVVWWVVAVLVFPLQAAEQEETCRNTKDGESAKRYFYVDEHKLDIRIGTSGRITHQLVSHIFGIILKEVIGYAEVKYIKKDGYDLNSTLQSLTGCRGPRDCPAKEKGFAPETMINLETWIVPGFNLEGWIATGEVVDGGPLGPIGRSGWYIPEVVVRKLWVQNRTVIDHWRAFQKKEITAIFDLSKEEELSNWMTDPSTKAYYCSTEECTGGLYIPQHCQQNNTQCATLLTDYPKFTLRILKKEIERLELLVSVAFLGANLEVVVRRRTLANNNTVFFYRKPTPLTVIGNFSHVFFPICEDEDAVPCELEVNQIEKMAWSKVKSEVPDIFYLFRSINFSQRDYVNLLEKYIYGVGRDKGIAGIACDWVKDKEHIWHNWIPEDLNYKTVLYIGGIFPLSGVYWRQSGVVPAAQMAVDAINNNDTILKKYHLSLLTEDGACVPDVVMNSFIRYVTNATYKNMVGILGPACSDTVEPIAGVAKHYNTIIISYSAEGAIFTSDNYPYFFRTIPENNQFRFVYLKLFNQLGWSQVAALTEDGQKYPEYISLLQDLFQAKGLTFLANRKFPRQSNLNMSQYLTDLKKKNARMIIGDFYDFAARAVMCEAYKQQMTQRHGYQWFLPLWFTENWYDTDYHNSLKDSVQRENVSCTTSQMVEAINGHFSLAYKFYADDDAIMQEGKTVKDWMALYKYLAHFQEREVSKYGGYTYDAVWVYALALHELLKKDPTTVGSLHMANNSRQFVQLINQTNFFGVSGPVFFVGSSRLSDVVIWQWYNNVTHRIGVYHPASLEDGVLDLNESAIVWLSGKKPTDGKESPSLCPLERFRVLLGVTCDHAIVVANLMGFTIFAAVMLAVCVLYKRKYEEKMKRTEARMKELGLMTSGGLLTLDEWEMPRDHIVINRKLGEGAFGTVFGGEALLDDKGWVAVAVKTLKVGANIEEKLDFLSEAEMMKRFDHKNIVQLIGVCTTGEPVYTVMEFMLYGDLKTYLLGRRNLVNEKNREGSDEVSDSRLTNMALDIARGLSYLAELKYVHRDLACRNCLVNTSRTVKIADFGMCRPMYDSDYYRFNKRGMLPVRWMAPESLIDGIFTTMSDVWSYGVLLYEIVTFGSFPYQGLSNHQVLDFVRNHNTLHVPKGCNVKLEALFLRCWSRNPQQRPQASEIVEILATNSTLIAPCLDMPIASVQVEDTDSIELTINERSRLHSVSSMTRLSKRRHGSTDQTAAVNSDSQVQQSPQPQQQHVENGGLLLPRGLQKLPLPSPPLPLSSSTRYVVLDKTRASSDYGIDVSMGMPHSTQVTSL